MALVLTQVYLEPEQKKALSATAKKTGRKASDLMRDAIDAMLMGISVQELQMLDEATKRVAQDVKEMHESFDRSAADHKRFMAEIERIRAGAK